MSLSGRPVSGPDFGVAIGFVRLQTTTRVVECPILDWQPGRIRFTLPGILVDAAEPAIVQAIAPDGRLLKSVQFVVTPFVPQRSPLPPAGPQQPTGPTLPQQAPRLEPAAPPVPRFDEFSSV